MRAGADQFRSDPRPLPAHEPRVHRGGVGEHARVGDALALPVLAGLGLHPSRAEAVDVVVDVDVDVVVDGDGDVNDSAQAREGDGR